MERKKYEFTGETIKHDGHVLNRIRALIDFDGVKKGDIGGWIESEHNLSHHGNSWVYDDAKVFGLARVFYDAKVYHRAKIYGQADVGGHAKVYGYAEVCDDATIHGNSCIYECCYVGASARIFGKAVVGGSMCLTRNASVGSMDDFTMVQGFGSAHRPTYFFRCADGKARVRCGCFYGTIPEFEKKVRKTHGFSKTAKEYLKIAKLMELHFKR